VFPKLWLAQESRFPMLDNEKRMRILHAAQSLFIRYGVKRTSIDEVARAADLAKGTLYLYYDSKEMLFAEVAKNICADILAEANLAAAMPAPLGERLVGILDAEIGVLHRLVEHSPHVRELTETKEAMASATFATLDRDIAELITTVISEEGIARQGAAEMFLAAAVGTTQRGDSLAELYRSRLRAIVDVLLIGLKQTCETRPHCLT
jgi:AcrR family transcriptional regulator